MAEKYKFEFTSFLEFDQFQIQKCQTSFENRILLQIIIEMWRRRDTTVSNTFKSPSMYLILILKFLQQCGVLSLPLSRTKKRTRCKLIDRIYRKKETIYFYRFQLQEPGKNYTEHFFAKERFCFLILFWQSLKEKKEQTKSYDSVRINHTWSKSHDHT